MKKTFILSIVFILSGLMICSWGFSGEMKSHSHSGMGEKMMDHSAGKSMGMHGGMAIHKSEQGDFALEYTLMDMGENIKKMKDMPGMEMMKATHHLMVNIKKGASHLAKDARVGFMITGPGGNREKAMAMGMGGGFGADIDLHQKGTYTIKTKVMAGEDKFIDEFVYEIK